MNKLQIFENPEFGRIRVMEINGEPWFVGKDVASRLGYSNSREALAKHVDKEDKGVMKCDTSGGKQDMTVINESGLYSLIMSSKLSSVKRFKRWVTSEVLPALRKTGTYTIPGTQQGTGMYRPTRPLTTDDYRDAAYNIRKCPKDRLPMVIDLYRKAGLELEIVSGEKLQEAELEDEVDLVELLSHYTLTELKKILKLSKSALFYYKSGTHSPRPERRQFIIKTLLERR